MNRAHWKAQYHRLETSYSEYRNHKFLSATAKDKHVKGIWEYKTNIALNSCRSILENDHLLYKFFNETEFGHHYAVGEFWGRYFEGDMSKFLEMLRQKIDTMPDDENS